jgi:hypothetical protein
MQIAKAPKVPGYVLEEIRRYSRMEVTDGYPRQTPTGFTEDEFTVGEKGGGARTVHLLLTGFHPTSAEEVERRLVFTDERAALWDRLLNAADRLRETYGVEWVAPFGSFGTTDFASPNDMDIVAFRSPNAPPLFERPDFPTLYGHFNHLEGEHGIHVYASNGTLLVGNGPRILVGAGHAPPNPRPESPFGAGDRGPPVGMVLMSLRGL